MKALIFGANGQDGHYLTELCLKKNIEPIGVSRTGPWIRGDVSSFEFVKNCIENHRPQYIFHIAANSTTRHDALFENHTTISTGTLNILEAAYKLSLPARIFITGSGVQFENNGTPISENTPFKANNPYSISRIHATYAARYYRDLGIKVYVGYLFHHESPLRKPHHVSQRVALAAKRIHSGSTETLQIGDLLVEKEWTFAGDIASAMFKLIEQDQVFEAVIGSGITHSIQQWIEACFSLLRLDWRRHVKQLSNFSPEYPILASDPKVMYGLGWRPSVGFRELARMMITAK
jgi:GDPmannose 4,6-dehydratase